MLDERTHREMALAGDDTRGGGLPLPLVFSAVVQRLLDTGPANTEQLQETVTASLKFKEDRVVQVWRSWPRFTRAILDQLADDEVIEHVGEGWWRLRAGFTPGKRYAVMGEWGMSITVYDRETRAMHEEHAKVRLLAREFAERLNRLGEVGQRYGAVAERWAHETALPGDVDSFDTPERRKTGSFRKNGKARRANGSLLMIFYKFWEEHPEGWYPLHQIADEWNERHADDPIDYTSAGSWRKEARMLMSQGKMDGRISTAEERRASGTKGAHSNMYRMKAANE